MTRAEVESIFERQVSSWNRHDPAAVALFHSADGIVESPMYATRHGRKAIEEAYGAFFKSFPDATMTVEAILIEPPYAAVFATVHATHMNDFFGLPGTNRQFELRHSRLLKLDESGLIEHERRIYDFTGVLVQLGVLRAKPAKP
jgi:steroid delta-isomerase-like uncharacterized protein